MINRITKLAVTLTLFATLTMTAKDWVVYEGENGPGKGKHIVFLSGDEEYRSEEGLPMLAKILAVRHGFKCTVLFAIDPKTGEINPDEQVNVAGMKHVKDADLVVMLFRFRELPDDQMKYFVDFYEAGKPIVALRTSTHAFNYSRNKNSPYAKFSFNSREWPGGFGQQVLGETWINHHGHHKREAARGLVDGMNKNHPILKGATDVWGDTDVYGVRNLPRDADVLLHGLSLHGMQIDSPPNYEKSLMPVAWIRYYTNEKGNTNRIFCTTMGSSTDLVSEGMRRLVVNACYWGLELEDKITADSNVDIVGDFKPTPYGFGSYTREVKPADHEL